MESVLTSHSGFSITEFTQNSNDINLLYIPVVNREWVLDTHTRYCICEYDSYLWKNGIFSNLTFYLSDFKRDENAVRKCIEANDGTVIDDITTAVYIVCPRTVSSEVYLDERAVSVKWLRACVDRKRLIPRTDFVLYRPYPALLSSKTVCLTGFGHEDKVSMESYIVYVYVVVSRIVLWEDG
jgi:singapore isolate B (sub-type 7) whole genome shotgun sequence assembly, scaffold_19